MPGASLHTCIKSTFVLKQRKQGEGGIFLKGNFVFTGIGFSLNYGFTSYVSYSTNMILADAELLNDEDDVHTI